VFGAAFSVAAAVAQQGSTFSFSPSHDLRLSSRFLRSPPDLKSLAFSAGVFTVVACAWDLPCSYKPVTKRLRPSLGLCGQLQRWARVFLP
jgi:hypothetical protein